MNSAKMQILLLARELDVETTLIPARSVSTSELESLSKKRKGWKELIIEINREINNIREQAKLVEHYKDEYDECFDDYLNAQDEVKNIEKYNEELRNEVSKAEQYAENKDSEIDALKDELDETKKELSEYKQLYVQYHDQYHKVNDTLDRLEERCINRGCRP